MEKVPETEPKTKHMGWARRYLLGMILLTSLATVGFHNATVGPRQQQALIVKEMAADGDTYGSFKQTVASGAFEHQGETYLSRVGFSGNGKYTFVFRQTKTGHELTGVYQELPQGKWLKGNLPITPTVGQLVTHLNETVGEAVAMPDALTVETTEGFYDIFYENERAVALYQGKEMVGKRPLEIEVAEHVRHYMEEQQREIGAITTVLYIESDDTKQTYYFETENGLYRLDAYFDGTADLLKAN